MTNVVLKNIKNTVILFSLTALLTIVYFYLASLNNSWVESILTLFLVFLGVFFIACVILFVKWCLYFKFSYYDDHKLSFSKGINKEVYFKCRDKEDEALLKMGAVYSITLTGANTEDGYINSLETNNFLDDEKKKYVRATLVSSWGIERKSELFSALDELVNDVSYVELNKSDFNHFKKLLQKNKLNLNVSLPKFSLRAFNLQRASLLLRDGLTCGMISMEEFDQYKSNIYEIFISEFSGFDDFIVPYLLGVYDFYLGPDANHFVFGVNRVNERMVGVGVLLEHNFFERDINSIVQIK